MERVPVQIIGILVCIGVVVVIIAIMMNTTGAAAEGNGCAGLAVLIVIMLVVAAFLAAKTSNRYGLAPGIQYQTLVLNPFFCRQYPLAFRLFPRYTPPIT